MVVMVMLGKLRQLLINLAECKGSMWHNPNIGKSSKRCAQIARGSDPD